LEEIEVLASALSAVTESLPDGDASDLANVGGKGQCFRAAISYGIKQQ